jgi:hypothetical protein
MATDSRRLFVGLPGFAAATIGLIAVFGWLLTLLFHGPGDSLAIRVSAVVGAAVQIAAFPAVKGLATRNLMLGWAAGTLVRFLTLVVYGFAAATVLHLPATAALVSLFVFYFLSMVIEPLFLRS